MKLIGQEIDDEPHQQKTDDDLRLVFQTGPKKYMPHADPALHCKQPLGYSFFPYEIGAIPKSWVATTGNLVWSNYHRKVRHTIRLGHSMRITELTKNLGRSLCGDGATSCSAGGRREFLEASVDLELQVVPGSSCSTVKNHEPQPLYYTANGLSIVAFVVGDGNVEHRVLP